MVKEELLTPKRLGRLLCVILGSFLRNNNATFANARSAIVFWGTIWHDRHLMIDSCWGRFSLTIGYICYFAFGSDEWWNFERSVFHWKLSIALSLLNGLLHATTATDVGKLNVYHFRKPQLRAIHSVLSRCHCRFVRLSMCKSLSQLYQNFNRKVRNTLQIKWLIVVYLLFPGLLSSLAGPFVDDMFVKTSRLVPFASAVMYDFFWETSLSISKPCETPKKFFFGSSC